MPVKLNHTIVPARDQKVSATFLAEVLGLAAPAPAGHFLAVGMDNGLTLDFCSVEGSIRPQHYAFEVSEPEFDAVLGEADAKAVGEIGGDDLSGKAQILLRAAVAALLNSTNSTVSYPLTTAAIIKAVNDAIASNNETTITDLASKLDGFNNGLGGCPLN